MLGQEKQNFPKFKNLYWGWPEGFFGFIVYTVLLVAAAFALPPLAFEPGSGQFILVVGFLALWRYTWGNYPLYPSLDIPI